MPRMLALFATLMLVPSAHAQYYPPPGSGVALQYNGGRFRVSGFLSSGPYGPFVPVAPGGVVYGPPVYAVSPYGVIERRVIVQPIVPAAVPRVQVLDYDLSGIDLDVESPDRLFAPGTAPATRPQAARPANPKDEVANKPPVNPPPMAAKPEAPAPPAMKPPAEDLLQSRAGAAEEADRLIELGMRAFREQEYGIATWRFRQASEVNPANARAFFLLGQAYIAVGQFRDAVQAIQSGLRLDPEWPARAFRPRAELYGIELVENWFEHRQRLDEAINRKPQDAGYLFLRGYVAWFDEARPQAVEWFHKARAVSPDPTLIDLFLKQAPAAPPVAAR